ncbi:hypothetical protein GCM10011487_35380 [Steroidobacter agaridevorans]|uniref:Polyketide cyclase n=1 Tax=Steroidobacter agaridevorans TaxID=2695856 RepID=A0A829YFB0_9GAMM|nr:hypothetical protein [Steroidobacter agaridevorans]GFE81538.1 hypothetical protein GCM10011487_35380 [Steroidobacter agaridevorans]
MSKQVHFTCTSGDLSCSAQRAWDKVCFYEHIEIQPSLLLRTVLPVPQRTSGAYRAVGDISRCMYSDGGYLTKQIRQIASGRRIDFDIVEQSIRYATRILLKGGTIQIEPREDGTCSVHMLTRYELRGAARFIPRFFINHVISAMHRIVITDMQARLAPQSSTAPSAIECRSAA